ncbi:MAG: thiamine phosphate synthase, partial [Bacteroidota bacterium]
MELLKPNPQPLSKGEGSNFSEWLRIAEETKIVCKKYGAKLIINDNVFIAKEISADGVHLGK